MAVIRKRFITGIREALNDDITGIDVDFDEESYCYTARCSVKKFKTHPRVDIRNSFQWYIQRRCIRKLDMVCINGDEPEVVDGRIVWRFQLCG